MMVDCVTCSDPFFHSIFSAVGCILLFFLSPIIGQASDIYGRKVRRASLVVLLFLAGHEERSRLTISPHSFTLSSLLTARSLSYSASCSALALRSQSSTSQSTVARSLRTSSSASSTQHSGEQR